MFTEEIIRQLKQVNISTDAETTQTRLYGIWKKTPKDKRDKILSLAGVALATVQRAYKTGSISAKLAAPIAQVLNINPFFLTGESDAVGECTSELLGELLRKHGYKKLLAQYEVSEKARINREKREQKRLAAEQEAAEAEAEADETNDVPGEIAIDEAAIEGLTEEDLLLLLKAILLRAKSGGKNAETAKKIKLLLLS
jgi:hypothetical protein